MSFQTFALGQFKDTFLNRSYTLILESHTRIFPTENLIFLVINDTSNVPVTLFFPSQTSEPQIRGGIDDNSKIYFLSQYKHMLQPLIGTSQPDGSNEVSQPMFHKGMWQISLKYSCYPFLSGALQHCIAGFHSGLYLSLSNCPTVLIRL